MANERANKRWGVDGRGTDTSVLDLSPKATRERRAFAKDFKSFYRKILAQDVKERSGRKRADSLGVVHDMLIDFLCLRIRDQVKAHSNLYALLSDQDEDGNFEERWIYWKRLDRPPEIQDGPSGDISQMFYERAWQGVIVRLKGNADLTVLLMPRGHLKSTLCTQGFTLWQIVRDPSERHLIRSLTAQLAKDFVGDIKWQFEQNDKFRRLYCNLGPPEKRDAAWNADFIQVKSAVRRGKEPTLRAAGFESTATGGHYDDVILDDIVGEGNSETAELIRKGRERLQHLQAVRDPGTPLLDVGTRWHEEDVHGALVAKDVDTCFMVATLLDGNPDGACNLGIAGPGNPIWPEKFTPLEISRLRKNIPEDRIWFGQYFNQYTGTALRTFKKEWIRRYTGYGEALAKEQQLHVFIGVDPASGKKDQSGKLDYTGICVLGQSQSKGHYYLLDGLKEKLPADLVPQAICDLALFWKGIVMEYGATFEVGIEESAYTNYLRQALDLEMKSRGVGGYFRVVPLKSNNVSKHDRIRTMALPFSQDRILWPELKLKVRTSRRKDDGTYEAPKGEPYDLIDALTEEFTKYPSVEHDDLIDAMAYAYRMSLPADYLPEKENARKPYDPSRYSRSDIEEETNTGLSLGGFDRDDHGGLSLGR
jgi:hypothetical protein